MKQHSSEYVRQYDARKKRADAAETALWRVIDAEAARIHAEMLKSELMIEYKLKRHGRIDVKIYDLSTSSFDGIACWSETVPLQHLFEDQEHLSDAGWKETIKTLRRIADEIEASMVHP